jgi:hypothetical protein
MAELSPAAAQSAAGLHSAQVVVPIRENSVVEINLTNSSK